MLVSHSHYNNIARIVSYY